MLFLSVLALIVFFGTLIFGAIVTIEGTEKVNVVSRKVKIISGVLCFLCAIGCVAIGIVAHNTTSLGKIAAVYVILGLGSLKQWD